MKSMLRASSALAVAGFAAIVSPTAMAQDSATAAPSVEEAAPGEIVVTAQKRAERLQDIPLAVSVLERRRSSKRHRARASRPRRRLVPSLNFLKSGTTLNQTIFLRGVGTASFSIAGEPSVSTVVDGVVYARSGEAFSDLVDIDRIEVLRGPQGTLFGKNASAGVINIDHPHARARVRRKPRGQLLRARGISREGRAQRAAGDRSRRPADRLLRQLRRKHLQLRASRSGSTATSITARGRRCSTIRRTTCGSILPPITTRTMTIAAPTSLRPPPINGTTGAVLATSANLAFNALPPPRGADTRRINQNLITATKESGWGASLQADVGLGSNTLTSITAYRKWNNTEIRDGDWLDQAYVGFQQLHDDGPQRTHTFTQELRLTSPAKQTLVVRARAVLLRRGFGTRLHPQRHRLHRQGRRPHHRADPVRQHQRQPLDVSHRDRRFRFEVQEFRGLRPDDIQRQRRASVSSAACVTATTSSTCSTSA